MSSKKNSDADKPPFYTTPVKHKTSVEVIREAKAEIKMMGARRPSTPFLRHNSAYKSQNSGSSRSSSGTSNISFSCDAFEKRPLSGVKLQPIQLKKVSDREQMDNLYLEPTVVKTPLIDRTTDTKYFIRRHESSIPDFPPIKEPENRICAKVNDKIKPEISINLPSNVQKEVRTLNKNETKLEVPFELTGQNIGKFRENKFFELEDQRPNSETSSSCEQLAVDSPPKCEDEIIITKDFRISITNFFPIIEQLIESGRAKNELQAVEVVNKLYKLLEKSNMLTENFEERCILLKLLFRLLDSYFPTLSLHIAKLALQMGITDKNLANIFKLLCKVCKDERNVIEFLECHVLDLFLESLNAISIETNVEALKYGISTVKNLSANTMLLDVLATFNCHDILLHHLMELNITGEGSTIEGYTDMMVEVLTALRHLTENDSMLQATTSNGTLQQLFAMIKDYGEDVEITLATITLISKIADRTEGCSAIVACQNACGILVHLLKWHRYHIGIVVQVTYIVGNLIAVDASISSDFYAAPDFLEVLFSVLRDYVYPNIQTRSDMCKLLYKTHYYGSNENGSLQNCSEIMTKIVRTLANMCLNHDVGECLARDEQCTAHLLTISDAFMAKGPVHEDISEPLTYVLVAINNISYFINEETQNQDLPVRIAASVLPLLGETYFSQVRLEACNIVRNLTRLPDVRSFILENGLMIAFITLLNESDEMTVGAYAIMTNLLLTATARECFYKENGVSKLLHRLHFSICRDWMTAALLCRILWNYCGGVEVYCIPLRNIEIQHLIKVLKYSTGESVVLKTDSEKSKYIWKTEFCPTATKLLKLLQTTESALS